MKYLKKIKSVFSFQSSVVSIVLIGAFLRFYNLGWGLPYPFHPDERNMADAIVRFSTGNLDPKFYAYGQFPLYLAYFTGRFFFSLWERENLDQLNFTQAILALRFWSAFFSTATIFVVYLISKRIFGKNSSKPPISQYPNILISPLLVAFTPGLIQAAHFGTTESVLTFCFLTIIYFSLKILEKPNLKNFFWAAFFLGLALGSKISAAVFATPIALAVLWQLKERKTIKEKFKIVLLSLFTLTFTLTLTIFTSPYLVLAFQESRGTLLYEISVAQGTSLPFYTRQFFQTTPVLFQFQKIFPYVLGWPIFILGGLGFILASLSLIKKIVTRKKLLNFELSFCILIFAFLIYFLPNAFLFAKWTRFMTPIFPFFSIFAAYFLNEIISLLKSKKLPTAYCILLTAIAIIPGLVFSTIYFRPDIRFTASAWIITHLPSGSAIIYDTGNVVDIPILPPKSPLISQFPNYSLQRVSFDFYDLDENPILLSQLLDYLVATDYIIVPSRRIFMNHLRFPEKYPLVNRYYQLLFSGELGFKEIKKFSSFPILDIGYWRLDTSDEQGEETYTVFDHPVIRIYSKFKKLTYQDYEKLLQKN